MRCGHSSCLALVCPNVIAWASDNRDEPHPDWVLDTWEREATAVLGFEFRWADPQQLTTCAAINLLKSQAQIKRKVIGRKRA